MKVLYQNLLIGSTITSSSETYLYEDDYIIDINSLKTWRSDSTNDYVVFETSGIQPDSIGIKNHNFTASATIKVEGNATDSWGSPSFTKTLTYREETILEDIAPVASYDFWRIYVDDSTNPDGYIEIGTMYLGNVYIMPGASPTHGLDYNTNSLVEFSTSNQPFGDERINFDSDKIDFPVVTNTQRLEIEAIYDIVSIHTPVFMVIWENDQDVEPPKYVCIVTNPLKFPKIDANNHSFNLEYREVQ